MEAKAIDFNYSSTSSVSADFGCYKSYIDSEEDACDWQEEDFSSNLDDVVCRKPDSELDPTGDETWVSPAAVDLAHEEDLALASQQLEQQETLEDFTNDALTRAFGVDPSLGEAGVIPESTATAEEPVEGVPPSDGIQQQEEEELSAAQVTPATELCVQRQTAPVKLCLSYYI